MVQSGGESSRIFSSLLSSFLKRSHLSNHAFEDQRKMRFVVGWTGLLLAVIAGLAGIASASELEGIQNCPNKCDKVFDKTQYAISDQVRLIRE